MRSECVGVSRKEIANLLSVVERRERTVNVWLSCISWAWQYRGGERAKHVAPSSPNNVHPPTCLSRSRPIGLMSSSNFHPNVSFLLFRDLFNAALKEYSQKTGKDIATDPLTARLLLCDSSDAVLSILEEQAHAFNQFRNGDRKVQLMRRLRPIVDILLGLSTSGVFGEGIGLVRLNDISFAYIYYPPCRDFHQHKRYLPVLVS